MPIIKEEYERRQRAAESVPEPVSEKPSKSRLTLWFVLAGIFCILVLILCSCTVFPLLIENSASDEPPEITLKYPEANPYEAVDPDLRLKLTCSGQDITIKMNDTVLGSDEIRYLCGDAGYLVDLADGENTYVFEARKPGFETVSRVELTVNFDKAVYDQKVAEQEAAEAAAAEKARQEEEAKWNDYATRYRTQRADNSREFGKLTYDGENILLDFEQGVRGTSLTQAYCRSMIDTLVSIMTVRDGIVDEEELETIVNNQYYMGMYKFYFFASIGNPDDINSSEYGTSEHDQVIYRKDYYGISSEYFYFDDDILTGHQDY